MQQLDAERDADAGVDVDADVVVIGSGQGGVPLAANMARQGRAVVLFERSNYGGSCINTGCTPSKAFLASAHAAGAVRHAATLGVHLEATVDFRAVMERIRHMVGEFRQGVEQRLVDAGVRLVRGEASFVGQRTVKGNGMVVRAPLVVIDTGKSPKVPDIPLLRQTPYLTYVNFWELRDRPERAIVLGAGYTGLELGQGLVRLGVDTHLLERGELLIDDEEAGVGRAIQESLEEDGVHVHMGAEATEVNHSDGVFTVRLNDDTLLTADLLLVATGREPNTAALRVGAAGIELDARGHIKVDDQFRTTCEGVYAIGDVTGQPAFTHVSWEDHRRLEAILRGEDRRQGDRVLAYAFFTEPQVGRAGLTLKQAQEKNLRARAVTLPLENVARASETGRTRGFYQMVVEEGTGKILGATLVGESAAELVHVFVAHMEAGSTWQTLERSVHIHPTDAEGLPSLARLTGDDRS